MLENWVWMSASVTVGLADLGLAVVDLVEVDCISLVVDLE